MRWWVGLGVVVSLLLSVPGARAEGQTICINQTAIDQIIADGGQLVGMGKVSDQMLMSIVATKDGAFFLLFRGTDKPFWCIAASGTDWESVTPRPRELNP